MRGKADGKDGTIANVGITPAYAGKRLSVSIIHHSGKGSPPPMRGKGVVMDDGTKQRGITPAYAGKRLTLHKIWQTVRDHPRLCGEKFEYGFQLFGILGSPPPMRGKEYCGFIFSGVWRITPAYAGKRKPLATAI